jgi:THO complex subunit 1
VINTARAYCATAVMASSMFLAVEEFGKFLEGMLEKARDVKKSDTIEPPLNKSDLYESFEQVNSMFPPTMSLESRKHSIDAAARDVFNNLLVSRI